MDHENLLPVYACINRCPVNAIDYGEGIENRQCYRFEEYTATLGSGDK